MDYSRRDRADRLAAEYALGTLRGGARRRFETLMLAHPMLREASAQWQARLHALSSSIEPVNPPPRVWQKIEARLFPPAPRSAWWQRLALWQWGTGLSSLAMGVLALALLQQPGPQAPVIVVLESTPAGQAFQQARFVAGVSADGEALVVQALQPVALTADRALELWLLPKTGKPQSLGLLKPGQSTRVLRAELLQAGQGLAVSVEPPGGSSTGQPTGPIVAMGKFAT